MIVRQYEKRLRSLLDNFPIVCVLGPRQCGKTTFIRSVLPEWQYLDLERPSDLMRISQDPEDALNRLKTEFIVDEAQQLPEMFPTLRSFVDQDRGHNSRLVLLGSASPRVIERISEIREPCGASRLSRYVTFSIVGNKAEYRSAQIGYAMVSRWFPRRVPKGV